MADFETVTKSGAGCTGPICRTSTAVGEHARMIALENLRDENR